jgi:hypothetical protein
VWKQLWSVWLSLMSKCTVHFHYCVNDHVCLVIAVMSGFCVAVYVDVCYISCLWECTCQCFLCSFACCIPVLVSVCLFIA